MSVDYIEFNVEEQSMEIALRALLPKIIGDTPFAIHTSRGKATLLKQLPLRLLGYSNMLGHNDRLVVIVDRDKDDCKDLKPKLDEITATAGLKTRATARGGPYVVNRIAVEELEAWFFGDWTAVRACYPRVPEIHSKKRYRDPDAIKGGTWEALLDVLQKSGYFKQGLSKIEVARSIAPNMDPSRNTSKSFCVFPDALAEMVNST